MKIRLLVVSCGSLFLSTLLFSMDLFTDLEQAGDPSETMVTLKQQLKQREEEVASLKKQLSKLQQELAEAQKGSISQDMEAMKKRYITLAKRDVINRKLLQRLSILTHQHAMVASGSEKKQMATQVTKVPQVTQPSTTEVTSSQEPTSPQVASSKEISDSEEGRESENSSSSGEQQEIDEGAGQEEEATEKKRAGQEG
ncbi:MAG: hypothetical protein WBQ73_03890 [Candidatus Babeliales bacterium]